MGHTLQLDVASGLISAISTFVPVVGYNLLSWVSGFLRYHLSTNLKGEDEQLGGQGADFPARINPEPVYL